MHMLPWWHWAWDGLNVVLMGVLGYQSLKWQRRAQKAEWQVKEVLVVASQVCDHHRFEVELRKRAARWGIKLPGVQN